MKIIISPTKKMKDDSDYYLPKQFPIFQNKTKELLEILSSKNVEELMDLFHCNFNIAHLNYERFQKMVLSKSNVSALFAYDGIAFQHISPKVFTTSELEYVEKHLYILSGFYGLLRCNDAISLYRLEMQTKLEVNGSKNLYEFWGDLIAKELFSDENCIINLASEEYSRCVLPYKESQRVITCFFVKHHKGKLKTIAGEAKMLRGEMVRFMATNYIEQVEEIKKFQYKGYVYDEQLSTADEWYFVCKEVI